ncbi:MAG: F0F1 ATP synthase subunit gamma, partial [Parasporobacterium sp.]|nr:F0F1 ATP synthase subunit gamma [Parasporobacterium sp.]
MQNIKELNKRIKSVSDTRKITSAMYMVSSAKASKARQEFNSAHLYFEAFEKEMEQVLPLCRDADTVLTKYNPGKPDLCLVITSDKGLVGSYNQNIIRFAEDFIKSDGNCVVRLMGEYGRQYFVSHNLPFDESSFRNNTQPDADKANELSGELMRAALSGKYGKIFVIYTEFINELN